MATGVIPSLQPSHPVAVWTSSVLRWSPVNGGACFIYDFGLLVGNQQSDIKVQAKLLYRNPDDNSSVHSKELFTVYPVARTRDYIDIELDNNTIYQVTFHLKCVISRSFYFQVYDVKQLWKDRQVCRMD